MSDAREPIRVDISYPRNSGNPDTVIVGLEDMRAADDLIVSYDFARDGWVLRMDRTREGEGGGWMEIVEEAVEVGFIPAWLTA